MSKERKVRVVCYLPDKINRLMQAQASLLNCSKQQLLSEVVEQYASKLNLKLETQHGKS